MKLFPYLKDIQKDIRYHGHAYIITDILFKVFSVFIWLPLVSFIFSYFLKLYGSSAVSNTDIINLILSPVGLITLLFGSVMLLNLFFAEHAILMSIAFASQNDRKIHWLEAFNLLRQKIRPLLIWGGGSIAILIVTLIPIFLVIIFLYSYYITEFDINYYLQQKPAEFIKFLSICLPLATLAIIWSCYLYISWLFALPIILFEPKQDIISLLRTTHKRLYGYFWHIARSLLIWWGVLFAISFLYQFVFEDILANNLFNLNENSSKWVLTVMTIMFFLEMIFNMIWQLIAIIGTVVIIVHIYLKQIKKKHIKFIAASSLSPSFPFPIQFKFVWSFIAIFMLATAIYLSYNLNRSINIETSVNIIAHRGASFVAPPNSRAAFLEAINLGVDYIELDVQETKDGVVIVHHDKDYKLSSNINKAVHELSWQETRNIDIGKRFSHKFVGEKVISLKEALTLAKNKTKVLIELKYYGHNQNLEQKVLDIVNELNMQNQVRYMSLNLNGMRLLKQLEPSATVGYISSAAKVGDLGRIDLDFIAVSTSLASRDFINHAQKNNKTVAVWTVDDMEMMMRFLDLNINDIITNRPERLKKVLAERKNMSKAELFISFYYHYWER